jgi:hypothetical protein
VSKYVSEMIESVFTVNFTCRYFFLRTIFSCVTGAFYSAIVSASRVSSWSVLERSSSNFLRESWWTSSLFGGFFIGAMSRSPRVK